MTPNFRVPRRLILWMIQNKISERIPDREHVFFKENIPSLERASRLVRYQDLVKEVLPPEMEALIATHPDLSLLYARQIQAQKNVSLISETIIDGVCAKPDLIPKMAGILSGRIARHEHNININNYVDYFSFVGERIPEIEDRILFSDSNIEARAKCAVHLIRKVIGGGLGWGVPTDPIMGDSRLKNLIKQSPEATCMLMETIGNRGALIDSEFFETFKRNGYYLFKLSEHIKRRLPLDLELTWEGFPHELVVYAEKWVRGPLPESLENLLIGNTNLVRKYAFDVIRANSSPRLSGALHNFMVLNHDENVVKYIGECERAEGIKMELESRV